MLRESSAQHGGLTIRWLNRPCGGRLGGVASSACGEWGWGKSQRDPEQREGDYPCRFAGVIVHAPSAAQVRENYFTEPPTVQARGHD